MTRDQLIDRCKFMMAVNDSQANDDISDESWIRIVDDAYRTIWNRLSLEMAPKGAVVQYTDVAWTANSFTYTLPNTLKNAIIYELWYVDSNSQPYGQVDATFNSRNVLTMSSFPGAAPASFNFRIYFIPNAEELAEATSEPLLIPARHHELLAWEALRTIKMLADKEVPQAWITKYEDLELTLMKEFQSRPLANRPNVRSTWSPFARPLF